MFNIGDYVKHSNSGLLAQIVGYGHTIMNGAYLPTLKVRVVQGNGMKRGEFFEDLSSVWQPTEFSAASRTPVCEQMVEMARSALGQPKVVWN